MKILGIDYGRKKIGLAVSYGTLATPLKVLRVSRREEALEKIDSVVKEEDIDKVVIGISEGKMAKEQKDFADNIRLKTRRPTVLWDETLSSQDAKRLSIEAGLSKKRRSNLEDAFAACIVLQSFLDNDRENKDS